MATQLRSRSRRCDKERANSLATCREDSRGPEQPNKPGRKRRSRLTGIHIAPIPLVRSFHATRSEKPRNRGNWRAGRDRSEQRSLENGRKPKLSQRWRAWEADCRRKSEWSAAIDQREESRPLRLVPSPFRWLFGNG